MGAYIYRRTNETKRMKDTINESINIGVAEYVCKLSSGEDFNTSDQRKIDNAYKWQEERYKDESESTFDCPYYNQRYIIRKQSGSGAWKNSASVTDCGIVYINVYDTWTRNKIVDSRYERGAVFNDDPHGFGNCSGFIVVEGNEYVYHSLEEESELTNKLYEDQYGGGVAF